MVDMSASGQAYNRFDNLDGIDSRVISYLLSYRGKNQKEQDQVNVLRKLIYYQDPDALSQKIPTAEQIGDLISDGATKQDEKRIFRSPYLDDSLDVRGSLLKVYIDSIIPENTMVAVVNVAIEVISNVEDIDIIVPTPDEDENSEEVGYQGNGNVFLDDYRTEQLKLDDEGNPIPKYIYKRDSKGNAELGPDGKFIIVGVEKDSEGNIIYQTESIRHIVRIDTESRVSAMTKAVLYLLNGAAVQGVGKLSFSRKTSIHQQAQYGLWSRRKYEGIKIVMGVRMSGVS